MCGSRVISAAASCARPWPGPGLVPGNTGHWTPRRVRISDSAVSPELVRVVASCGTTWPRCHEPVAAVASRSVVVAMVCRGWRRAAAAACRTAPPRAVPMFPGSSPCLHSAQAACADQPVMQYRHRAGPPRTPASPPRRCVWSCERGWRWRGQRRLVAGGGGGGRDSVSVSIPSPVSTRAPGRRSVQSCGKVVSAGASPPSLPPLFILLQVRESRTAGHDQKLARNQSISATRRWSPGETTLTLTLLS